MSGDGLTVNLLDPGRVPEAVRLHCEAFAKSPSGRLGSYYVDALFRWFLDYDGAVVLGAVDPDGHLVGYAIGAPAAYSQPMGDDLRTTVAGALLRRPWALFDSVLLKTIGGHVRHLMRRGRVAVSAGVPPPAGPARSWSLVAIAVSPSHRRSAVGRRLLAEFEDHSRERGAAELRLTVVPDNVAARRLYERAGWEPGSSRPDGTMSYSKRPVVEPTGT